ncbi:collagen-binding domain-containing protein, partial [Phaeodactylibacter luteus]
MRTYFTSTLNQGSSQKLTFASIWLFVLAFALPQLAWSQLAVQEASTRAVSECGAADGRLSLSLVGIPEEVSSYTVVLSEEKGETTVEHLPLQDGQLIISGLPAKGWDALRVISDRTGEASPWLQGPFIIPHNCTSNAGRATGCGFGTINYQNCDGEQVVINRSNLLQYTFIYTDNDYLGCIAYVNGDCQVEVSQQVYCGDFQLTEPTPAKGYEYGEVKFTLAYGLASTLGVSELTAERINWAMCNGPAMGFSKQAINQAIWGLKGDYSACNALCSQAQSVVTAVQGGIDEQMAVFVPQTPGIQPFIVNDCYCSTPIEGLFINNNANGQNVIEIQDGDVIDASSLPFNYNLEAEIGGSPGSVRFSITGDYTGSNVENTVPYNAPPSGADWNEPSGTFTVLVQVYSQSNANGHLCDERTFTFSIFDCIDEGGHISGDEQRCGSYDPAQIVGEDFGGLVSYQWEFRPPGGIWLPILFANGKNYDPGTIAQTTEYRRSVTSGVLCTPRYSNTVVKTVLENCQPVPEDWAFDCDDDKLVEEYGFNAKCQGQNIVHLPSPGNIYQYAVEIVYKGGNPGEAIPVSNAEGDTYNLLRTTPGGGSSNVWVYRGLITGSTGSVLYANPSGFDPCKLQSIVVYAFRNQPAGANAGVFTAMSGYNNIRTVTIPIPTDEGPRDITLDLPISELTPDGRYLKILASAGGQSAETYLYGPDEGLPGGSCCLAIPSITIPQVPGNATEVVLTIDTRNGQNGQGVNGQSWVIAGLVNVETDCFECDFSASAMGAEICAGGSASISVEPVGGEGPFVYQWSDGLGSSAVQQVAPSQTKAYSVTITDANNCTATANVMVVVNPQPSASAGPDLSLCPCAAPASGQGQSINPLAAAGQFNVLVEGDFELASGDSDGPVAGGGALTVSGSFNSSMATPGNLTLPGDARPTALIVGGQVYLQSGSGINVNQNGFIKIGNLNGLQVSNSLGNTRVFVSDINGSPRINLQTQQPISSVGPIGDAFRFDAAFAALRAQSAYLSTLSNNVTVSSGGGISLTDGQTNVWNTTVAELQSYNSLTFNQQPSASSPLIVNVQTGGSFSWNIINQAGIGSLQAPYMIWNFYDASSLTFTGGATLNGSVLAPHAHFTKGNSGNIDGQVVAAAYTHLAGEVHNIYFQPQVGQEPGECADPSRAVVLSASGGATYAWSTGQNSAAIAVNPVSTTTYTVTVTSAAGCSDVDEVTVAVQNTLQLVPGDSQSICAGGAATLQASATGGQAPYSFEWSDGLGSGSSKQVMPAETKTYTVTATDNSGCTAQGEVTVVVNDKPEVVLSSDNNEICAGALASLTALPSGGQAPYTFQWSPGLSDEAGQEVSPMSTTSYGVTLTDANGCTAENTLTIVVNAPPVVDAGEAWEICQGQAAMLSATASQGEPPYLYEWSGGLGTGAEKVVSPPESTIYAVSVTDANGCTATDEVMVTVDEAQCAGIGDFVWHDENADGLQGPGEMGVPGVSVQLTGTDVDGESVSLMTSTDADGFYLFDKLVPGIYTLQFSAPSGFIGTSQFSGSDGSIDSDADPNSGETGPVELSAGEYNPEIDAGFYGGNASIALSKTAD